MQDDSVVAPSGSGAASKSSNRRRSGTERPPVPPVEETPEMKARKALIEKAKVSINGVKTCNAKIERDLKEVDVVIARLKSKPWDTTVPSGKPANDTHINPELPNQIGFETCN